MDLSLSSREREAISGHFSDDDTWALKNCSIDILDQSNTTAGTASSSLAAIP